MFGVGTGEILLILVIVMLVVGPERMVELASELGRMIAKFRAETDSVTREFREAISLESEELQGKSSKESPQKTSTEAGTSATQNTPATAPKAQASASPPSAALPAKTAAARADTTFADSETEVVSEAAGTSQASAGGQAAAEAIEVSVAALVPEDHEVEPTVLDGPMMVVEEQASENDEAGEAADGRDVR